MAGAGETAGGRKALSGVIPASQEAQIPVISTTYGSGCRVLGICGSELAAERAGRALAANRTVPHVDFRFDFTRVSSVLEGLGELAGKPYDVILVEIRADGEPGLNAAAEIQRCAPGIPLILIASAANRDAAVAGVRAGARDFFVIENLDAEALRRSVKQALEIDKNKSGSGADRRNNARFPCRLSITWRTLEQPIKNGESVSETVNISSKGILFATEESFEPGQLLQVSLDWPARLGNEVPLKLVAEGRVLRNAGGQAAMSIERYEFRTRKGASQQPPPIPAVKPPQRAPVV